MIDMATSFRIQVLFIILGSPAIVFASCKMLMPRFSLLFALGSGLLLSAGASFLVTLFILQITSSGRGWGGLIFIYVLLGEGVIGAVGLLLLMIALVRRFI